MTRITSLIALVAVAVAYWLWTDRKEQQQQYNDNWLGYIDWGMDYLTGDNPEASLGSDLYDLNSMGDSGLSETDTWTGWLFGYNDGETLGTSIYDWWNGG